MDKIRCNVYLLNRRPGNVIEEADIYYRTFLAWAQSKARHGGKVICEFIPETPDPAPSDAKAGIEGDAAQGAPADPGPAPAPVPSDAKTDELPKADDGKSKKKK